MPPLFLICERFKALSPVTALTNAYILVVALHERINSKIDGSFRFERHFIRGKGKMTVRAGLAVAVMMALAVGHIRAGRPECMRSLVSECNYVRAG